MTRTLELTAAQVEMADWLLGLPLFCSDSETVEQDWGVPPEVAARLIAAAKSARLDGSILTVPDDQDLLSYLRDYVYHLEDMTRDEYLDQLIADGVPYRQAQCKVNAKIRAAEALASKLY